MSDQSGPGAGQSGSEPESADAEASPAAGMPQPAPMPQPPPMSYGQGVSEAPQAPAPPASAPPPPAHVSSAPQHGDFVLVNPHLQPTTTGLGTGGLVSGIGSCLLALLSCCWWPLLALPAIMGIGAMLLGFLGMRQVSGSGGEVAGRGVSIAAIATGGVGLLLSLLATVIGLIANASGGSAFG